MVRRRDPGRAAFTLIELLMVIAIVVALAGLSYGTIKGAKERVALRRAKSELAVLALALEEYRQRYGDFPQTGGFEQAPLDSTQVLPATSAQVKFLNALTGVYGPARFADTDRVNGPVLVDVTKLTLEPAHALTANFGVATGAPPQKAEERNAFVDPWGRRYLYYYRNAGEPGAWRANGFVLYSAGPDGEHIAPDLRTGLFAAERQSFAGNADNVYADRLP